MNIATRGGVEFLAVFLGLFLSLWFDDYQEDKEVNKRLKEDYRKIHVEINEDLIHIDTLIAINTQIVRQEEYLLSVLDGYTIFDFDTIVFLVSNLVAPTFFGNQSAYSASVASGRFNMSKDDDLVQPISKLYEHYYKRLVLNGDLIDQRSEAFDREHALQFFKPIYKSTTVDTLSIKEYFFGDKFHNGLLLYHDFRKKYYLERLRNTRDKLVEVDSVLMEYNLNN
jgi:hypothetical protein